MTCIRDDLDLIDVAIVGAGPAGLAAALYTARVGLKTVVFGDPYQSQLAKAGIVENYLTFVEPIQGLELVEKMIAHSTRWGAQLREEEIRQITRDENLFHLVAANGIDMFCAYTVILAMGTKFKKLGVKGEEEFYARGVSYCTLCDGPLYKGAPVAVVGFGNEAAAAALRMSAIASSVDLISTHARLGADMLLQERLEEAENVTAFNNIEIKEIAGDASGVTHIRFQPRMGDAVVRQVKAVFVEVGTLPASALAADLGVELEGQFIKVQHLQETNVPGIFAAGDLTGSRARQAAISVGDGTRAAIGAIDYIKALGLSTEKSRLQSVQWGSSAKEKARVEKRAEGQAAESLQTYIQHDAGFQRVYEAYKPDLAMLDKIREHLPQARVVTISASWCPDCRRNVPRLARISQHLPDWKFEIYPREDQARAKSLDIRAIPTFIVYQGEKEIGRIIENPTLGSLEADLWEIVLEAGAEKA
jgi:thioredoxin reductase (NADPH)